MAAPCEDLKVETIFKDHGIEWESRPRLRMDNIDVAKSRSNQGRLGQPIDEDHAASLAIAFEEGSTIPPIVVYKHTNGKFVIVDGNHRHFAAELLEHKTMCAYELVRPTARQIKLLTYKINTTHGKPLSLNERIHHAMDLVESGDVNRKDAAAYLAIPESRLATEIRVQETVKRLIAMGKKPGHIHQKSTMKRLSNIGSDYTLGLAFDLIVETGMTTKDVDEWVGQLNRHRSEAMQENFINQTRKRMKDEIKLTGGGFLRVPQSIRSLRALLGIVAALDLDDLKSHAPDLTDAERKRLSTKSIEAASKLRLTSDVLQ